MKIKKYIVVLLLLNSFLSFAQQTFVVTSNIDPINPFNPPAGTLRWAIEQANASPGLDYIHFNIPGNAPSTIQLNSLLPAISDPVHIDGVTQPVSNVTGNQPKIILQGNQNIGILFSFIQKSLGSSVNGIKFKSASTALIQLFYTSNISITNNVFVESHYGVLIYTSSNNVIRGNYFGTESSLQISSQKILEIGVFIIEHILTSGQNGCCNIIGGYECALRNYFYNTNIPFYSFNDRYSFFQSNILKNNQSPPIILTNVQGVPIFINGPNVTAQLCSGNMQFYGTANQNEIVEIVETDAQGKDVYKVLARVQADANGNFCTSSNIQISQNSYVMANAHLYNAYNTIYSIATTVQGNCTPQPSCMVFNGIACDISQNNNSLPCEDCLASFSPTPGKKYLVSAWVKENTSVFGLQNYDLPQVKIYYHDGTSLTLIGTYTAGGKIIDGWQKIENEFFIPSNATQVQIKLECTTTQQSSNDCYFDDIRVFPFDASLKSYVYDPINMRFVAELDERNYATFYEYDEEGKLTRIKKETEKGIMTIQEVRKNNPK